MLFSLAANDDTDAAAAAEKTLVPAAWPSGIAALASRIRREDCAAIDASEDWRKQARSNMQAPFCRSASNRLRSTPAGRG